MAKRDADSTTAPGTDGTTGAAADALEQKMLAFAEQLGRIVGTVQAKAEGWLDRDALNSQISTVRDSASELLNQLGGVAKAAVGSRPAGSGKSPRAKTGNRPGTTKSGARGKTAAKPKISAKGKVPSNVRASATSGAASKASGAKGRSGGAVDAPGKKHRRPMPSESGATGTPRGEGSRIAKLKALKQNPVQRRG